MLNLLETNSLETNNAATEHEQQLQLMSEQARMACSTSGKLSSECAVAWDAVEEFQAAAVDRQSKQKTNFDRYCDERPDALECRLYDV